MGNPTDTSARREDTFAHNVASLRTVDPDLATTLEQLTLPDHVRPATGRDGAVTYRLRSPDGDEQWFGRTSMPTVSGPAVLAGFDPGDGNVALPGIGSGYEARLLCRRLRGFQAVFVLETDALPVAMALRLVDLADPIASRRLVLFVADPWEPVLTAMLEQNEGFVAPSRLMRWLWLDAKTLQGASEAMSRSLKQVQRTRDAVLADLAHRGVALTPRSPLPEQPNVAIVTGSPAPTVSRLGRDLYGGASALGWAGGCAVMDSPAGAHTTAHVRAVVESNPDVILSLDYVHQRLAGMPDQVPFVIWLSPAASVDAQVAAALGCDGRCVVMTDALRRDMLDTGCDAPRILSLPLAAQPSRYDALEPSQEALRGAVCDVAMIAAGADIAAEACNLRLTSHQALWGELTEVIGRNVDTYHDRLLDEIITQAQRRSGVTLGDPAVRTQLMGVARTVLGPTLQRLAMVRALTDAGLRVGLWGPGWDFCKDLADVYHGSVVSDAQRVAIYRAATLTMVVEPDGVAKQELMDAVACGAAVMIKTGPPTRAWDSPAAMFDLQDHLAGFADRRQLVATARRLLSDADARQRLASRARDHLLEQHTYRRRLVQLRDWLGGQGQSTQAR